MIPLHCSSFPMQVPGPPDWGAANSSELLPSGDLPWEKSTRHFHLEVPGRLCRPSGDCPQPELPDNEAHGWPPMHKSSRGGEAEARPHLHLPFSCLLTPFQVVPESPPSRKCLPKKPFSGSASWQPYLRHLYTTLPTAESLKPRPDHVPFLCRAFYSFHWSNSTGLALRTPPASPPITPSASPERALFPEAHPAPSPHPPVVGPGASVCVPTALCTDATVVSIILELVACLSFSPSRLQTPLVFPKPTRHLAHMRLSIIIC